MKLSKKGEIKLQKLFREQEIKHQEHVKELAFHGQEQDGWHGEMYGVTYEQLLKEQSKLEELSQLMTSYEIINPKKDKVSIGSIITLKIDGEKRNFF